MSKEYSILITVYNKDKPKFLRDALFSIMQQTVQPRQIVLIGDGPLSSELMDVISEFVRSYNKLEFYQLEKNVGLGEALNHGMKFIKTNIVMRMDSDDYSIPERAEVLLNALEGDAVIVGSWIREFKSEINDCKLTIKYDEEVEFSDIYNYKRDPVGHASCLFYKDIILRAGGYQDCLFFEDTYLWLRVARVGKGSFKNVQRELYFARIGDGFYERRSGYKYALIEIKNFIKFYKENLISKQSLFLNLMTRPVVRLLPKSFISYIYRKFLRAKI